MLVEGGFCLTALLFGLLPLAADDSPLEDLVYSSFDSAMLPLESLRNLLDLDPGLSLESLLATKLGFIEVVGLEELIVQNNNDVDDVRIEELSSVSLTVDLSECWMKYNLDEVSDELIAEG